MAANGVERLVLASASSARQAMLANAGVSFAVVPSNVDEGAVREALAADDDALDPADVAEVLARAKADDVSAREPGALVIAADQVLAIEGRLFEKPCDDAAARAQLLDLRGKTHVLHSAVVLARGGEVIWAHVDAAEVTMRNFSATFLGRYMAMAGPKVLQSVGCYQLEGPGVQLIEKVSGDYFTVLGLPLFPLLAELRTLGTIDV